MPESNTEMRRRARRRLYYRLCAAAVSAAFILTALAPLHAAAQESGMPGLVSQRTGGKTAYACIFVGAGPAREAADSSGVSGMLARVIVHSQGNDGVSPTLAVERLGGRLDVEVADGYTCFTLLAPKTSMAKALTVVASALASPALSETALRQERRLAEGRRDAGMDRPIRGVYRRFLMESYPEAPYSFLPDGDYAAAGRLGMRELKDWHDRYYTQGNMLVSFAGDIPPESVESVVRDAFKGGWSASGGASNGASKGARREYIKESTDTELAADCGGATAVIGYSAPPAGSPGYAAMKVVQAVLADGMGSTLFGALRQEPPIAYSFGSIYPESASVSRLAFYVSTGGDGIDGAVEAVKKAVAAVKSGSITDEQVARAKAKLAGELEFGEEGGLAMTMSAGRDAMLGPGGGYTASLAAAVTSTGKAELSAAARKYMEHYTLVVVRPAK